MVVTAASTNTGDQVSSLLNSYAPEHLIEDEDGIMYLSSMVEELIFTSNDDNTKDEEEIETSIMELVSPFFGEDSEHEDQIKEVSKKLASLAMSFATTTTSTSNDVVDLKLMETASFKTPNQSMLNPSANSNILGQKTEYDGEDNDDDDDEKKGDDPPSLEEDDQCDGKGDQCDGKGEGTRKKKSKSPKGVRRRGKGSRKKKGTTDPVGGKVSEEDNLTASEIKARAAQELQDLDDHATAWLECQKEGKLWGGRGHGGRGLRSMYTSTTEQVKNVHLQDVSLQFAGNDLLQHATIQITEGKRYGLIGRNGVGKSTLLRRLAAKAVPGFPMQMRVLLVQQEVEGTIKTALQTLMDADESRKALLDEQERLETLMESDDPEAITKAAEQLSEVVAELDMKDIDSSEEKAREILKGLQFTKTMINRPTNELSGGWKMRLSLAQSLFVPSDLLLLDEPTNHLDLHAVDWLANYLSNESHHTLVVVSHDQTFLDQVCTDIIHFEHQKLKYHPGNYTMFQQVLSDKAAREAQILDATERQRAKAQEFIQKQQQMASSSSTKKHGYDPNKQRQAKMMKDKKLDRLGNYREDGKKYKNFSLSKLDMDYVRTSQKVHIEADEPVARFNLPNPQFPPSIKREDAMISLNDVTFSYDKASQQTPNLQNVSLQICPKSKCAVVGRNGSGKSTLLKIINGAIDKSTYPSASLKGDIMRQPIVRVGNVAQHDVEDLDRYGAKTVVEYTGERLREHPSTSDLASTAGSIRQYLGAFGLGGKHATRQIATLSGGERMRLCFATVFATRPHILILDEPTNHLDMETLDVLSTGLDAFQGAVVIVSHNQRFLSGFCNELWIVENNQVLIKHSDASMNFEELFTSFRSASISTSQQRSEARSNKAIMARQAAKTSRAPKHTAFI